MIHQWTVLQQAAALVGCSCVLVVYFRYAKKLLRLFDELGGLIPSSLAHSTRVTRAFLKIFKIGLYFNPETEEEKKLVREIVKVVRQARIALLIGAVCTFVLLTVDAFRGTH